MAASKAAPAAKSGKFPTFTRPQVDKMDGKSLDKVISGLPHLRELDLDHSTALSPEALIGIKRTVVLHHLLWSLDPKPVTKDHVRCDIELNDGALYTNVGNVVPTNPATQGELRKIIQGQLDRNIIEPSTSQTSATVLLVPKPNGGIRFVVDYRALNNKIKGDAYTLPTVQDALASLSNRKIFTSVDMKEAFWNVPLTAS